MALEGYSVLKWINGRIVCGIRSYRQKLLKLSIESSMEISAECIIINE
jgi:hypothetical protein